MYLQFREIAFKDMEALFHGLPFYIILSGVVQGMRGNPPSRCATFRKESLDAEFEFSFFAKVERIYLGVEQGRLSAATRMGHKTGATFSSSRSSLKKKAALWA